MALLEYKHTLQQNIRTNSVIYVTYIGALMNAVNTYKYAFGFSGFYGYIFLMA